MEKEGIYVSAESSEYITFDCRKCKKEAKLITIRPDEPNPSTDLKHIHILGFEIKCLECGEEGFFKLNLAGAKVKGVGNS